ncbi:MAG: TonB-dependent receptor [Bacteroidales bacterium]|nr:TonB-dependent receptor [Bacteroidales bacterium]
MLKFILILLFPLSLWAQKGRIEGRIVQKNNEPIPFANVVIIGTSIGASSDFDGKFIITALEPGFYKLQISSVGHKTLITQDIQVITNKTTYMDFTLEEQSYNLNQIEVTAERFVKKEESPVSMRSIGISEIENSAGANRDIARIIQNYPGVAAFPVANRNDIIVRGGATNESRYFVDDVEIPYINHFATQGASGGTNGIINADLIRDVNFYAGAFPANKYNALSGVFDFKTVDGNPDKTRYRATIGASEISLTADGPLTDKATYILSLRRSYLQFLFKALGLPFLPTFNDYQTKVRYRINNKNEITFLSIGALDQMKLDTKIKNPTEEQRYILNFLPVFEQWNYAIGTVYKHYEENGYSTLVISRNMLNNSQYKYFNNTKTEANKLIDYKSQEQENKFRFEKYFIQNGLKINAGIQGEYATYDVNNYQKIFYSGQIDTLVFNSSLSLFKYGIYGQLSKNFLSERLSLSIGVRTDATPYSSSTHNPLKQLSPRVSASYELTEKWSINANWGNYYQLPSYTILGYKDKNGIFVNKQNGIRYIQANHYILGFSFLPNKLTKHSLEGFYKEYKNYPFLLNDSISLAFKPIDYGFVGNEPVTSTSVGRAYGIEYLLQTTLLKNLNLTLSYTFAVSEFKNKQQKYRPTSWDNRHILNLTANKKFSKNWNVALKWRFAGGLPYTPYDLERSSQIAAWDIQNRPYFDFDNINGRRFKSFHQLDVRVEKRYTLKKTELRLYLDVQNIYNFKSEELPRITNLDQNGNIMIDPNNSSRYLLREVPSSGSGTILPTIGIIFNF